MFATQLLGSTATKISIPHSATDLFASQSRSQVCPAGALALQPMPRMKCACFDRVCSIRVEGETRDTYSHILNCMFVLYIAVVGVRFEIYDALCDMLIVLFAMLVWMKNSKICLRVLGNKHTYLSYGYGGVGILCSEYISCGGS